MTKKIIKTTMATIAMMLTVLTVSVCAYSDEEFLDIPTIRSEQAYTVITDIENKTHRIEGVIDAEKLEDSAIVSLISDYTVYFDNEKIIEVKLNDIIPQDGVSLFTADTLPLNGYYAVDFTISEEDKTHCFMTGLSDSNLNKVQSAIISAKLENTSFSIESMDFIDAEKTVGYDNSLLCWAAETSNLLHYSGWAKKAQEQNPNVSFTNEDDIFDIFNAEFTDEAGYDRCGVSWFFNGLYSEQQSEKVSHVKRYGESGGYLKQYYYDDVYDQYNLSHNHTNISKMMSAIRNGSAIGVVASFLNSDGSFSSGHALTLWGYIYNENYAETDLGYLEGVLLSDSDTDIQTDENRRTAPNTIQLFNTVPYTEFGYDSWLLENYGSITLFSGFSTLLPYSDDITYEDDPDATLDSVHTCDFVVNQVTVSNDKEVPSPNNVINNEENSYVHITIQNNSDTAFNADLEYSLKITDSGDNIKFNETVTVNKEIEPYCTASEIKEIGELVAGDYKIEIKLNPNKKVTESYLYNNTYEMDFSVAESSDTSNMTISANIGEFEKGRADVKITYTGLDALEEYDNCEYSLYNSFFVNGEWSMYFQSNTTGDTAVGSARTADKASPPESCTIETLGEKVKFKLVIKRQGNEPLIIITSDEYDLEYKNISLKTSSNNTGTYTKLDKGATQLTPGEKFAFNVVNTSTINESVSADVNVYAKKDGEEDILLYTKNVSVEYGQEKEISFSAWKNTDLSGMYYITAEIDGEYGYFPLELGELYIKENPSLNVTTTEDIVNEYDGKTSLREAIAFAKDGEKITFAFEETDTNMIDVTAPLVIDKHIIIEGDKDRNDNLYGIEKTQIIKVTEKGHLEAKDIVFNNGYSTNNGGAVENNGGIVTLTDCVLTMCKSGRAGGAVYSNGGTVKLKNCVITGNESGNGGAVFAEKNAKIDMLNCNVFENTSNTGVICNHSANINIIYSSLFNNTAKHSHGGAVTSLSGNTNVIGCIVCSNKKNLEENDNIDGNVSVYGSYYSNMDQAVKIDEYSVEGESERMFACDEIGNVKVDSPRNSKFFKVYVSPLAKTGIYIKNNNGNLLYSKDNETWIDTEVKSAFTNDEYTLDINGITHQAMFGASYDSQDEPMYIGMGEFTHIIYMPEKATAVMLTKTEDYDGRMTGLTVDNVTLDIGTNHIKASNEAGADIKSYMLWDSLEGMKPLMDKI